MEIPNLPANPDARASEPSRPWLGDRRFFGHPVGLGVLSFVEGCVGFSFYGMQSLLVLYMTGELLKGSASDKILGFTLFRRGVQSLYGPVEGQALAAAIMGLYAAAVYLTPILGGLLADRFLGATRTIGLGALLMTAGHFLMAFNAYFLLALALIIVGMGLAGTLKAQVGDLYASGDLRRADAFQIYILGLNISVIIAPLVCGTLGETVNFHLGFMAAGAGMLLGLAVYVAGGRVLPQAARPRRAKQEASGLRLSRAERRTVAVLLLLLPVLALAAVGNMEIFNAYLVWGQSHFQRVLFGFTLPVSWLLSLDAFISTGMIGASLAFWRWWSRRSREPDEIVKVTIGAAIAALAPLLLALAALEASGGRRVSLLWGVAFHIVNDIGFANVYAVGLALFSRAAPKALGATIVNAYSLHLFLSNLLVGYLAGLLNRVPGPLFWLLHAGLVGLAALVLLLVCRLFRAELAPGGAGEAPALGPPKTPDPPTSP